jgi:hypothetical protein
MPFADDLLLVARDLANLHSGNPSQAALRRAVSPAYYALFHLLISDATSNWSYVELRPALGRLFDHGPMRAASEAQFSQIEKYLKGNPPPSPERTVSEHLRIVAKTFVEVQRRRQEADYNTAQQWTLAEMEDQINDVAEAFRSWSAIRESPAAQAYLLSLLGTKGRVR